METLKRRRPAIGMSHYFSRWFPGAPFLLLCIWTTLSAAAPSPDYPASAKVLDDTISQAYAYEDKLPEGRLPQSSQLSMERATVHDEASLLHYAEDRMMSLADHHAITASSFRDSWAIVPTYADLWIVLKNGRYVIDSVRDGSPAALAGIKAGQLLTAVDGVDTAPAVQTFWRRLGLDVTDRRAEFAARVLAAGRRDRDRRLTIADATGKAQSVTLPSLYAITPKSAPPITISKIGRQTILRFNNSLGDGETIGAFDKLLAQTPLDRKVVLDLRDTPSGGNTSVARAIMGWFVARPQAYQVHNRPIEERETGVGHQWIEQVLPRAGKYRPSLPTIWVGRWTGSMGEGLAIGFASMGAIVRGSPMAGLNGSVEDIRIDDTKLVIKLPTERLMTTTYLLREDFRPKPMR